jgi:photosystem II stability/assembly factor-like uncharacterized protein
LLLVAFGPAAAVAQDDPRQKQIEEIRREIEELNRRLKDLETSPGAAPAKAGTPLPEGWLKGLRWRSIGPANMGGRIVALSVYEAEPSTWWIATASGGLLKTENNGITFEHQFDRESTVSIGDVCVAPSDKKIVWVGTGEGNPRNSASYGDGVYKSVDGGKTWKNMGLKDTYQIGRIVVHPKDPNIVYVGALGRLWGHNEDRGVYKTTDGGETWEKVLYVDDKTGVIDIDMSPSDPETLLAATYQRKRDIYDTNDPEVKWGPGSGLHRTTDGGKTWEKVTEGLPDCTLGRIGVDFCRSDPKVAFAIVESEKIGSGPPSAAASSNVYVGFRGEESEDKAQLAEVVEDGPAGKAGLKAGDIIAEVDGEAVKNYEELVEKVRAHKPGDQLTLKGTRGGEPLQVKLTLAERPGRPQQQGDPAKPFLDSLGGQRENVQDRQTEVGKDAGGVYRSDDGGITWTRVNSLNPRPMYFSQIRVDPSDPKYVYVLGISMYRSQDGGKTFRADGGRGVHADGHALWIDPANGQHMIHGCDGGLYVTYDRMVNWDHLNTSAIGQFYHVALDTNRFYNVYGGLQDNGTWGGPSRTRSNVGPINEDWLSIGGGDGFQCQVDPTDADLVYFTSQNGGIGRRNLRTGEVAFFRPDPVEKDKPLRFNWNTPFILSKANPKIYYVAGNHVFRSLDKGDGLRPISKEITTTDKGSATALSESPLDPDVLYVGTDDGALWVTKDGGREWTRIDEKVGLPRPMCVATIEASRAEKGRVYVAFDGHRSDLDAPFAYVSEDFGEHWASLNGGLPRGSTRCLREDIANPEVLYLGTEFGAWVSIDRGASWASMNTNLPTVAVHELAQHPKTGEIVAATHGRSLWIADVSPIRQTTAEVLKEKTHLYAPLPFERWHSDPSRGRTNRRFAGENPSEGVSIYYHLGDKAEKASVKVYDVKGQAIRTLSAGTTPGLQRVVWDLTRVEPRPERRPAEGEGRQPRGESGEESSEGERPQGQQARGNVGSLAMGRPRAAEPGSYRVVLEVDGKELVQTVLVLPDPLGPADGSVPATGEEEGDEDAERELRELRERDRPID